MKRGTPAHPKTRMLAGELGIDVAHAMGLVEMLCNHFAPDACPQGNVGKWTDEQIVAGLQTTLPADRVVAALVRAGWFETSSKYRLVIHDYHEHADRGVRNKLSARHLSFVVRPGSNGGRTRVRPRSDPGRSGAGSGSGSSSVNGSTSPLEEPRTPDPEQGARRKTPWRRRPTEETLTPSRVEMARVFGLSSLDAEREWAAMGDHEYEKAKSDCNAAWRMWCRNWLKFGGNGKGRETPSKAEARTQRNLENLERFVNLGKEKA